MSISTPPLRTFGRIKSRTLRSRQTGLLQTLLPKLALPLTPFDPRLLDPAAAEVWLEVGFGAGEHLTGAEMAAALARALGREIVYRYVPPEVYRTFGFPGADDLGNMFQFMRDFTADFCAARSVEVSRSLNPALLDFSGWLAGPGSAMH